MGSFAKGQRVREAGALWPCSHDQRIYVYMYIYIYTYILYPRAACGGCPCGSRLRGAVAQVGRDRSRPTHTPTDTHTHTLFLARSPPLFLSRSLSLSLCLSGPFFFSLPPLALSLPESACLPPRSLLADAVSAFDWQNTPLAAFCHVLLLGCPAALMPPALTPLEQCRSAGVPQCAGGCWHGYARLCGHGRLATCFSWTASTSHAGPGLGAAMITGAWSRELGVRQCGPSCRRWCSTRQGLAIRAPSAFRPTRQSVEQLVVKRQLSNGTQKPSGMLVEHAPSLPCSPTRLPSHYISMLWYSPDDGKGRRVRSLSGPMFFGARGAWPV